MKPIILKYTNLRQTDNKIIEKLTNEQQNIKKQVSPEQVSPEQVSPEQDYPEQASPESHSYHTRYASLNLPFDQELITEIHKTIKEKRALNIDALIVIGIGGSNLGTIAIHEAINGLLYNTSEPPMKCYFADTTDATYIAHLLTILEKLLQQDKNILINVVTKSGTTAETIANLQIFLELLKRYRTDYRKYIVVTTDKDSKLDQWAAIEKITRLHVPKLVGGRYSVFSPVGLFPLGMTSIDIDQLIIGAKETVTHELTHPVNETLAGQTAAQIYQAYKAGYKIHDLFIFSKELESVGKWYRQLMGESLGKPTITDPQERCDLTPTVSIGSTDLHSVAQLYLGGLPKTVTTFLTIERWRNDIPIQDDEPAKSIAPHLAKKTLTTIMDAIFSGTYAAYAKQNKPALHLILPEVTPYYIGSLLQMFMIQMIYLGTLLDVNPFDQPQVELYKTDLV